MDFLSDVEVHMIRLDEQWNDDDSHREVGGIVPGRIEENRTKGMAHRRLEEHAALGNKPWKVRQQFPGELFEVLAFHRGLDRSDTIRFFALLLPSHRFD